jgi:hypothetical protein
MNLRLIFAFCAGAGLLCAQTGVRKLAEADCTTEKLGASIPIDLIGEPVAAVTLSVQVGRKMTLTPLAEGLIAGARLPHPSRGDCKQQPHISPSNFDP